MPNLFCYFAGFAFLSLSLTSALPALAQSAGSITGCKTAAAIAECTFDSGGGIRIEPFANNLVRIRVSPDGQFQDRSTGALVPNAKQTSNAQFFDTSAALYLQSPQMTVGLFKAPLSLVIWRADGSIVNAMQDNGLSWDLTTGVTVARFQSPAGEHYLGLGERGGSIDRRGRKLTMRNTDWAGASSLSDPLYISIPFFYIYLDGAAAGVYVDSGATPFFDFDSQGNGSYSFGVVKGDLDYYVMAGPDSPSVARNYRQLTGPNQLPPIWSFGYHQSRYSYISSDEVFSIANSLRSYQIPADVLYFDIDCLNNLQLFSWNTATFPDPGSMNSQLHSMGFHSVNIMEPIVRNDDPLFPYLSQSGFLLTDGSGQTLTNQIWFGTVGWLDFSKSAVRNWYQTTLQAFLGSYNIDGVWNDLNEPAQNFMPNAVYDYDGQPRTDSEARDLYALQEAQTSYLAQLKLRPNTRPWIFSRSGFSGLHRYAANWGGDADSTFSSLQMNVEMTLSMGLSGQPLFGHDIGGFLGSPSAELFLRWMSFSAYTPLFRNHAMNTSARREPWAFGEPYLTMARNIINDRYTLIPYIYSLFFHDAAQAQPVVTPLPFYFSGDEMTYLIDDEFLLGQSLLVAPIFVEGASYRWVYLPAGASWIDKSSDTLSPGGGWALAFANIDQIPVYVKDGSIIPRTQLAQSTSLQTHDRQTLDLYCGVPANFDLYEDDGLSFDYAKEIYLLSSINCKPGQTTDISIDRTAGAWRPPNSRQWQLNLHRTPTKPSGVSKSGTALPFAADQASLAAITEGWTYTTNQQVIIKVNDQPTTLQISVKP